jgi:predicted dehydrogenase
MTVRLAIVGFRHAHMYDLYRQAQETEGIRIVAVCEEDATVRRDLQAEGRVQVSHSSYDQMLDTVDCNAVAVGDYFAKRGSVALKALSQGKHVISDKPICTRLAELDQIEEAALTRGLRVGCMLDMRDSAPFIAARDLVLQGVIGEVHAVSFDGQHPLLLGKRPQWFFEPGRHGGTINDIGIHAIDIIPWITGLGYTEVAAARCWNAFATGYPHFQCGGQMMLTMGNGCGVLGDVSYFAPNSSGYVLPFYWRMTFWGRHGVLATSINAKETVLALDGENGTRTVPLPAPNPGGYLRSFLHDIDGHVGEGELCTEQVLRSTRVALKVQQAADQNACHVPL